MMRWRARFRWFFATVAAATLISGLLVVRWNVGNPLRSGAVFQSKKIGGIAYRPDGRVLAAGAVDGLYLWSLPDRHRHPTLGAGRWYTAVAWSHDGRYLAAVRQENSLIDVWQSGNAAPLATLAGHQGAILSLAWGADDATLASASADSTVMVWNVSGGNVRYRLQHPYIVFGVSISPDGQQLASAGNGLRLWDLANGKLTRTFSTIGGFAIAFSPDGTLLATGDGDKIQLWSADDGALVRTMTGHTDLVGTIAFSPDGRFLASGSGSSQSTRGPQDTSVRIWRLQDGRQLASHSGHRDVVTGVAFSPDGTMVASSSDDGTVRFWTMPSR
jgi:WD40 repeat protein